MKKKKVKLLTRIIKHKQNEKLSLLVNMGVIAHNCGFDFCSKFYFGNQGIKNA